MRHTPEPAAFRGCDDGATRGENDKVEGSPEAGKTNAPQLVRIAVEIPEKIALWPHLADSGRIQKIGHRGPLVWSRNRDKAVDAIEPAEALHIIAANEAAHAEADEIEALAGRKGRVRKARNLSRELIQPELAPTRDQAHRV